MVLQLVFEDLPLCGQNGVDVPRLADLPKVIQLPALRVFEHLQQPLLPEATDCRVLQQQGFYVFFEEIADASLNFQSRAELTY